MSCVKEWYRATEKPDSSYLMTRCVDNLTLVSCKSFTHPNTLLKGSARRLYSDIFIRAQRSLVVRRCLSEKVSLQVFERLNSRKSVEHISFLTVGFQL